MVQAEARTTIAGRVNTTVDVMARASRISSVPLPKLLIPLLCLAVVAATSLGLNRGMVFCVGHDGHVAIEPAHGGHACRHDAGAGDEPAEAEHADAGSLTASAAPCSDADVGTLDHRVARADRPPLDLPLVAAILTTRSDAVRRPTLAPPGTSAHSPHEVAVRGDLARLSCVVLVV